jgi:acyl-CoA synthetase (NDP forming)
MPAPRDIVERFRKAERSSLDEAAAKELLAAYGIAVPRRVILQSEGEIQRNMAALAPPFALKLMSKDVSHKSDVGGVKLGLKRTADIQAGIRAITTSAHAAGIGVDGFLLEEMAPRGHELVIGGVIDRTFGPVVMVGLGGVFVEVLADIAFRIAPIRASDAHEMLQELRGAPILKGARGGSVASEGAIVDVLLRIGGADGLLMDLASEVGEIDINPLIVSSSAAVAVDARIILTESAAHD